MEETREMELKPGTPVWQWVVLVILVAVIIGDIWQGFGSIIKYLPQQSPPKLVGIWVIPGQKGNLIFQSDGTGFSSSGYTNPDTIKWEEGGSRIEVTQTNVTSSDSKPPFYVELTSNDNLLVFASATAKSPMAIMIRQK